MLGLALDSLTEDLFTRDSLHEKFREDPRYELVKKIQESMTEVGHAPGTWSEVREAYQKMRRFSIDGNPDFEARLDHITDTDGWGKTKHAKICVDGVFAFYLYYKNRHILTIGYSIAAGKKVLIGNMQAPKETKGWGLQFLPQERLEYIIDLFKKTFVDYELYLIDGKDLMDRLMNDYRREHDCALRELAQAESPEAKLEAEKWCAIFRDCIEHLEKDRPRLESRYRRTGRFTVIDTCSFGGIRHHRIR